MKDSMSKQTDTKHSRVARRRARVRADLLSAARQVFTTRGYQDATITEIVQVADIAMGTFYLHFRDKEELLVALAKDTLQVMREQVHAAIEQHANAPLIPLIMRALLRTAGSGPAAFRRRKPAPCSSSPACRAARSGRTLYLGASGGGGDRLACIL